MEDDDEFGDLYTDVLRPLSAAPQLHQTSSPAPPSLQRPVDLNLKSNDQVSSYPAYVPDSTLTCAVMPESHFHVLDAPSRADKGGEFTDNNDVKVKFDIEEGDNGISNDDDGAGIEIPGISQNDVVIKEEGQNEGQKPNDVGEGEEDDWESDSEDDLQIVLNEENHRPMLIEEGGGDDDDDDEDEDGNPLVIVADEDASKHQGLMVDEQEWGGDDVAAQMGDGGAEKKDGTVEQANVAASAVAATAKIGYRNHFAYHNPYHSQFKVSVT